MSTWIRPRSGVVPSATLAVIAFLLLTEHRAHVLGYWPYLLLIACPLLHMWMHGGHGSHDGHGDDPGEASARRGSRHGPGDHASHASSRGGAP